MSRTGLVILIVVLAILVGLGIGLGLYFGLKVNPTVTPISKFQANKLINIQIGKSERLGNGADAWWFANAGAVNRDKDILQKDFHFFKSHYKYPCFMKYLLEKGVKPGNISMPPNQQEIIEWAKKWWIIYFYDKMATVEPYFSNDMKRLFREFTVQYPDVFVSHNYSPNHLVIHYRVGDFLKYGYDIPPQALVDAINFQPSEITIMDGGCNWGMRSNELNPSINILQKFRELLQDKFPNIQITQRYEEPLDLDVKFMIEAPYLMVAGGSLAMLVCLMHEGKWLRSPACKNLNFPKDGQISPGPVPIPNHTDWQTYSY